LLKWKKGVPKRKSLPHFGSYDDASEWLNNHSTADLYATPVKFTVAPDLRIVIVDANNKPLQRIPVKKQISRQIQRIAKHDGVTPQQLVQGWLQEKIQERLPLLN
jgi:hypothetical protein